LTGSASDTDTDETLAANSLTSTSLLSNVTAAISSIYDSLVLIVSSAGLSQHKPAPGIDKKDTTLIMTNNENLVPATPRIISPTPETSSYSKSGGSSYFTSKTTGADTTIPQPTEADPEVRSRPIRRRTDVTPQGATEINGNEGSDTEYLSPTSMARTAGRYLRDVSRSPSPLGLIPIHQDWRYFVSWALSFLSRGGGCGSSRIAISATLMTGKLRRVTAVSSHDQYDQEAADCHSDPTRDFKQKLQYPAS
jgi:hypothetical protein